MDLAFPGLFSLNAATATRSIVMMYIRVCTAMFLIPLTLCLLRPRCSFNLEFIRSINARTILAIWLPNHFLDVI